MEDFIPTRGSQMIKDIAQEFVLVNYESSRKRSKKNDDNIKNENVQISDKTIKTNEEIKDMDKKKKQELEMKRIRYEVMKFGMSGFQKKRAKKANIQLAISLGAKPPKNRKVNYKVLKLQRQQQKESQKKKEQTSGLKGSMMKYKNKSKNSKIKKNSGILDVYGKVNKKSEGKQKR